MSDTALWSFALDLYRHKPLQEFCLKAQQLHGCDVPLLLFGAWLACADVQLSPKQADAYARLIHPWKSQVIRNLRVIRQTMKQQSYGGIAPEDSEALREQIKKLELSAEKLQLQALYQQRPTMQAEPAKADKLPAPEAFFRLLSGLTDLPTKSQQGFLDCWEKCLKAA